MSGSRRSWNVLTGLVWCMVIVVMMCIGSTDSSVINDGRENDFQANSMLRDSTNGKGDLNTNNTQHYRDSVGNSISSSGQEDDGGEVDGYSEDGGNASDVSDENVSASSTMMMMDDRRDGRKSQSYGVTITGRSDGVGGGVDGASKNELNGDDDILLPLNDQVRLLSKQLNALMVRRREDYELLENNLRKSLRITNNAEDMDMNIRGELDQLRHEIKTLREGHIGGNKEKLTVEWISQSIAEIRKELSELQDIASKASKDVNQRTQNFEDLATIKSDFHQFRLELEALKERQQTTEVFVKELREDSIQREEDLRRILLTKSHEQSNESGTNANANANIDPSTNNAIQMQLNTDSEADHKRRHHRIQRQQLHELELAQRDVKRQLNELQYHRIGERVRNLEIEQHRIAGANFNLSRQIASLDKLHSSMLELLEDVEGIHNKMDKTLPDVRREISKLEFSAAQLNSEQSLIREEGQNVARSVQAMAVSVSALQEERDTIKDMQIQVDTLRKDVERLQSITELQKSIVHRRIEKMEMEAKRKAMLALDLHRVNKADANTVMADDDTRNDDNVNKSPANRRGNSSSSTSTSTSTDKGNRQRSVESIEIAAQNLVEKLESVELQYESIINKLPNDCSRVEATPATVPSTSGGLYLIAPAGQNKPIMAHCTNGWTTIQRRFDGSVDFNRSWEAYANGFGTPSAEYWIGNEMLHHLTSDNCTELKIVMQDIYDNTWYAEYKNFYISSREDGYRLHIGGYTGNASDALDYQNEMQFSAIDVDRDISNTHCAANYEGGWWFSHCQHANLNGRYNLGLTWFDASRNEWIAVKSSQMLITKRQSCNALVDAVHSKSNSMHKTNGNKPSDPVTDSVDAMNGATNEVATASTNRNAADGINLLTIVSSKSGALKTPRPAVLLTNAELTKSRTTTTIASVV